MRRIMDNREAVLQFVFFCIEGVAEALKITGTESYDRLASGSDVLHNYIIPCYEALHTQGKEYIIRDILSVMESKK